MAIQLEKENGKFNIYIQHFLIDSAADLQTLESEYTCHQGDKAELPDGSYYLRHSDDYQGDLWELVKSSGGSGGSGSSDLPSVTSADNGDILTVVNGAWDKGEAPYVVSEDADIVIPEQTVTTVDDYGWMWADISADFESVSDKDTVIVIYNDTNYTVTALEGDGAILLGELDEQGYPIFENYPFYIEIWDGGGGLVTEAAATVTLSAIKTNKTITLSDSFKTATQGVIDETLYTTQDKFNVLIPLDSYTGDNNESDFYTITIPKSIISPNSISLEIIDGEEKTVQEYNFYKTLRVIFDGTSYDVSIPDSIDITYSENPQIDLVNALCYGAGIIESEPSFEQKQPTRSTSYSIDFSEYPFKIDSTSSTSESTHIMVSNSLPHTIQIGYLTEERTLAEPLKSSVEKVATATAEEVVKDNEKDWIYPKTTITYTEANPDSLEETYLPNSSDAIERIEDLMDNDLADTIKVIIDGVELTYDSNYSAWINDTSSNEFAYSLGIDNSNLSAVVYSKTDNNLVVGDHIVEIYKENILKILDLCFYQLAQPKSLANDGMICNYTFNEVVDYINQGRMLKALYFDRSSYPNQSVYNMVQYTIDPGRDTQLINAIYFTFMGDYVVNAGNLTYNLITIEFSQSQLRVFSLSAISIDLHEIEV